jgi:hypothetical protein
MKRALDEYGVEMLRTYTCYNDFYIPIEETRFIMVDGYFVEQYLTKLEYEIDFNFHVRTIAYDLPTSTTVSRNICLGKGPVYEPISRTTANHNGHGNPL